jgi:hypothetical protein
MERKPRAYKLACQWFIHHFWLPIQQRDITKRNYNELSKKKERKKKLLPTSVWMVSRSGPTFAPPALPLMAFVEVLKPKDIVVEESTSDELRISLTIRLLEHGSAEPQ